MKSLFIFEALLLQICFVFILFMSDSCSHNRSYEAKGLVKTATIKPPIIVPAGTPKIFLLDTCVPPYYIKIPLKDSVDHVYNTIAGPLHIKLGPSTVKPADFFVDMPVYDADKGLAINSIIGGFQDKSGNLWLGTNGGGLTRYDGSSSVTFTVAQGLGNNQIRDIAEDSIGNLWFVMGGGGVAKYDGRMFTNLTTQNGLASNEVRSVTIDKKGNIWFGTYGGGVSCYDGKSFKNYTTAQGLASNKILSSIEDKDGNLWFGTEWEGVCKYDGNKFTKFTSTQGLVSYSVGCMAKDINGNLWFGTAEGISKYDGKIFTNFATEQGLANNNINCIREDRNGKLWIGTYGGGISQYNGKAFLNFTTKQGLADNFVTRIFEDKSGNLWFGTSGGVNCYRGNSIINFTTSQGLSNNTVRSILKDSKGNLWFGTNEGGVCRFDGNFFTHFTTSQGLYNNKVHSILEDRKGDLWFGSNGGVARYDGKSFTNFTTGQGLGGMGVRHILEDDKGNLWFCTETGGITKYDGKKFITYNKTTGLPGNDIRSIVEDKYGNFWIGTHGAGICRFNGKTFTIFNTDQGLANNFVFSMRKDTKGNIWICTGNGGISILKSETIEKLDNQKTNEPGFKIFENFTTEEGLADNVVYDVSEDKHGNMLAGTNLGITLIKGGAGSNEFINRDSLEYYHWKVGYPIKDVNTQAMYTDNSGIIWLGTSGGLIRFDYAAMHKDSHPPEVRIKTMKVNNENVTWYNLLLNKKAKNDSLSRNKLLQSLLVEEAIVFGGNKNQQLRDSLQKKFGDIHFDSITPYYPLPVNLKLPYKHNSVTFSFSAIEPARPAQVHYQYMLKNYDKDWSPITTQTTATFGNINEGNYTFKVKAQSPDGIWSEPVGYSFQVLPPLWRSKGFILLYIITICAILFFSIRYRVASVRKKEQEKAKHEKDLLELEAKALRAQMNPHFIFNCLNSIKSMMQEQQTEKGIIYLTTFSKLIRTLFNNADKKLISLYDEIETCKFYLQLEAMRFDTKFSYSVNVDDNIDLKSIQVPALIIQPFIENAIWHGIVPRNTGGKVSLNVLRKGVVIEVIIDDDGIGREASAQNKSTSGLAHQSKGVNLTQSRLELNNLLQQRQAKLETIDKKDETGTATGTKVIITIKEEV